MQTGTTPVSEKLYDLCMIEKLCRGNQEEVKKMVQVFISQVPQAVEDIKSAYKNFDFISVKKVAHRIKPVLGYYAIVKIEKEIRDIEEMAEQARVTYEMEATIEKLDTVIAQIVEQMKKTFLN